MDCLRERIENGEIITKSDIYDYMLDYIMLNGLDRYIEHITFRRENIYGGYYSLTKRINVSYDELRNMLETNYNSADPRNNAYNINGTILRTSIHELKHAEQRKIILERTKDKIIVDALRDSFSKVKKPIYLTNHDDYIIEHNANTEALFEVNNILLDQGLGYQANNCTYMYKELMKIYTRKVSDKRLSPIEYFYYLMGTEDYTKYSFMDYSNISSLDKILYGLPLQREEIEKILKLGRQENRDLFEYFEDENNNVKKIKRNSYH